MKLLKSLNEGFRSSSPRERLLITAAIAIAMVLGGNLLLLKPQQIMLQKMKTEEQAVRNDFLQLGSILIQIKDENARGIDPFAAEKAQIADHKAAISQVEQFFQAENSTASQVGELVRNLIRDNPDLALVSLKTLPGAVFYTPPAKPKATTADAARQMMSQLSKKEEEKVAPEQVVFVSKTLYKHGVEVQVKGSFPALLAYMQQMERYPRRIFWSESFLDAKNHRAPKLKVLIYTLSDQASPPLN